MRLILAVALLLSGPAAAGPSRTAAPSRPGTFADRLALPDFAPRWNGIAQSLGVPGDTASLAALGHVLSARPLPEGWQASMAAGDEAALLQGELGRTWQELSQAVAQGALSERELRALGRRLGAFETLAAALPERAPAASLLPAVARQFGPKAERMVREGVAGWAGGYAEDLSGDGLPRATESRPQTLGRYVEKASGGPAPAVIRDKGEAAWLRRAADRIAETFGPEFMEGEQVLVSKTPMLSHPMNLAGRLVSKLGRTGSMPDEYSPGPGRVFRLPSYLVPADAFSLVDEAHLSADARRIVHVMVGGRRYIRVFIHPTQTAALEKLNGEGFLPDPERWVAAPGSSGRTLAVINARGVDGSAPEFPGFFAKASTGVMGRYSRRIDELRVARAVAVSSDIERIHAKSKGRLQRSGKSWTFMPETFGAVPKDADIGGYILRERRPGFEREIKISWYGLIASREGKARWIDELYAKSGRASMEEFVREDLVIPLSELYALLSVENGLTPELHQQNTVLVIDRATGKVKGIEVRDMDGSRVNRSLRRALGLPRVGPESLEESLRLMQPALAQGYQFAHYRSQLRMESLLWVLPFVLDFGSMRRVLRASDRIYLEEFNRVYGRALPHLLPPGGVKRIGELDGVWDRIHASVTDPKEKEAYARYLADVHAHDGLSERLMNALERLASRLALKL